jgi:hypothetical protein
VALIKRIISRQNNQEVGLLFSYTPFNRGRRGEADHFSANAGEINLNVFRRTDYQKDIFHDQTDFHFYLTTFRIKPSSSHFVMVMTRRTQSIGLSTRLQPGDYQNSDLKDA